MGIISLGCARNLVDSEVLLGSLKESGFDIKELESGVDVGIVNTCAFIQSARDESVDIILQAAQLKKEGKIKRLIVCGCLPQLYKEKMLKELPEVDLILGTSDIPKIKDSIAGLARLNNQNPAVSADLGYLYDERSPRYLLTPRHYAYVKVSEGCSNHCSYCIISRLRGLFRSRSIDSIINEIKKLSTPGALREINLIGQDTTLFGMDRYGKPILQELLKRICEIKSSVRWVRLLYTHPAHYTDELISAIHAEEKVCKYIDLPIQHISDKILKKMNRHTTKNDIIKLLKKLRKHIPGLALRTSVIVGFPGETDHDFKELLDFVSETKFERLGAFIYSKEDGTEASGFKPEVLEKVKKERFDELMKLQQRIASKVNESFLNKTMLVLIDEKVQTEENEYLGRTEYDAPEADGTVHVTGKDLKVGEFYKVKITDTMEYDLVGRHSRHTR